MNESNHHDPRQDDDRDLNLIDRIVRDVQSWLRHANTQWSQRSRAAGSTHHRHTGTPGDAEHRRYYSDDPDDFGYAPHRGKGPRNYARPDPSIHEDVCERLTGHGGIDASDIAVTVTGGVVTLEGKVDSRASKRLAESLIESISGVQDVDNRLELQRDRPVGTA